MSVDPFDPYDPCPEHTKTIDRLIAERDQAIKERDFARRQRDNKTTPVDEQEMLDRFNAIVEDGVKERLGPMCEEMKRALDIVFEEHRWRCNCSEDYYPEDGDILCPVGKVVLDMKIAEHKKIFDAMKGK